MLLYSNFDVEDLLLRLNRGGETAFDESIRATGSHVTGPLIAKNEHACMDILHDVFTWVWENGSNAWIMALRV